MKTLCALIGAFFLVAGIAVLVAGPPATASHAALKAKALRPTYGSEHRPLLWEADIERSGVAGAAHATDAASRNR